VYVAEALACCLTGDAEGTADLAPTATDLTGRFDSRR
jgi:hypothetical protein